MKMRFWMALAAVALMPTVALTDDWKDESGKGRGAPPPWAGGPPPWAGRGEGPPLWPGRGGEPPDWARGRGVWDGHFKHGRPPVSWRESFRPPIWDDAAAYPPFADPQYLPHPQYVPDPQHVPAIPDAPGWAGDPEDDRERLKDLREREWEAFRDWQKDTRERRQEQREREQEAYEQWREWQREHGSYFSPPLRYPAAPWQ